LAYVMGIPSGRGFPPECEGFSLNSVHGSRIEDFLRIFAPRGSCFHVFGSSESFEFVENSKVRRHKQEGIIGIQAWKLKFFIAENQTSLVQSNRRACLAQTGDE
jgi:hypothetical protein